MPKGSKRPILTDSLRRSGMVKLMDSTKHLSKDSVRRLKKAKPRDWPTHSLMDLPMLRPRGLEMHSMTAKPRGLEIHLTKAKLRHSEMVMLRHSEKHSDSEKPMDSLTDLSLDLTTDWPMDWPMDFLTGF